jgi:uncharacterized phosphosugar-binding protein
VQLSTNLAEKGIIPIFSPKHEQGIAAYIYKFSGGLIMKTIIKVKLMYVAMQKFS